MNTSLLGNAEALTKALTTIISEASKVAGSFAAPFYTVNLSSRLANSRDIYIPLFENNTARRWSGNLKKFKLTANGQIIDKNGNSCNVIV